LVIADPRLLSRYSLTLASTMSKRKRKKKMSSKGVLKRLEVLEKKLVASTQDLEETD